MIVVFGLILLLFCLYPSMDWRPAYEQMIGLQFLAAIFSIEIWRKIHWSVGLALFILFASGIHNYFFPSRYPIVVDQFIIEKGAGEILYSMVSLLLFSSLLLFRSDKFFKYVLRLLFICAFLDSLVLIFNFLFLKQHPPYAMLNNGTADAAFIVCLLPVAFANGGWIIMIAALLLTKSNTAIAGIGIALAFYLLPNLKFKKWLIIMIPACLGVILLGSICLGGHFLGDSGRWAIWQGSWKFYRQFANPWIGFGTGTFTVWGVAWQQAAHINDIHPHALWAWLHLEPLEILFENGIIGLVSAALVFFLLLKRTFKRSIAFPIACVYGFTSLTEMPLRLWVTQILGVCLLSEAFKKDCESIPKR